MLEKNSQQVELEITWIFMQISTETDPPAEGTFTKDSQELKYYYTKPTSLGVEVQYLTIQHNDETGMDEEVQLAEPTFLNGDIGEEYRTTKKTNRPL